MKQTRGKTATAPRSLKNGRCILALDAAAEGEIDGSDVIAHTTAASASNVLVPIRAKEEKVCINPSARLASYRFLHSNELLAENLESTDDESEQAEVSSLTQSQQFVEENLIGLRGNALSPVTLTRKVRRGEVFDDTFSRTRIKIPPRWVKRHLHRSVSLDDLMEYQREFTMPGIGRSTSDRDLTVHKTLDHFPATIPLDNLATTSPGKSSESLSNLPCRSLCAPFKHCRKSIANSDLDEFKRIFHPDEVIAAVGNASTFFKGGKGNSMAILDKIAAQQIPTKAALDSTFVCDKTPNITDTNKLLKDNYQWGTRSLRRALLGSDLIKFGRSVRTEIMSRSRDNSSASLDDGLYADDGQQRPGESHNREVSTGITLIIPTGANKTSRRDFENTLSGNDWGTRSLRQSLRELHLRDVFCYPAESATAMKRLETINGDEEAYDGPLMSPWQDDKLNFSDNPGGPKMPQRASSEEYSDAALASSFTPTIGGNQSQSRSRNNSVALTPATKVGVGGGLPEFEWQVRSPFRRSISSSDLEKYQRHTDGGILDKSFGALSDSDEEDEVINREVAAARIDRSTPQSATSHDFILAAATPIRREVGREPWTTDGCASKHNDATPKKPQRNKNRRGSHRRSNSDDPVLFLESEGASDMAPRKPTRTTSRPSLPPAVIREKPSVRFATNQNFVVDIPKVDESMKSVLYYTKRDVKRFRMNEHRRQEERIRDYMEYLNAKDNALDPSPSIFDKNS